MILASSRFRTKLTYVDILNGKGSLVIQAMENTTVKGKKLKVSIGFK